MRIKIINTKKVWIIIVDHANQLRVRETKIDRLWWKKNDLYSENIKEFIFQVKDKAKKLSLLINSGMCDNVCSTSKMMFECCMSSVLYIFYTKAAPLLTYFCLWKSSSLWKITRYRKPEIKHYVEISMSIGISYTTDSSIDIDSLVE